MEGVRTTTTEEGGDGFQEIVNNYWRPSLTVIGQEGLPKFEGAPYVVHPKYSVRCSLRLPPTLPHESAISTLTSLINRSDTNPFNLDLKLSILGAGTGFNAPTLPEPLLTAL